MKRIKLLLVVMMMTVLSSFAHDFEVDGIYYKRLSDTTVGVTCKGYSYSEYFGEYTGEVVIPSIVTYNDITYSVISIIDTAFFNCSGLTSITIPNSVTSIGNSAFSGCTGLTSVAIPNSVISIGSAAFYGCTGLTSVAIPNSVISIGSSAFEDCTGLTSVTIGNSVTSIEGSIFRGCSGLTSITIPNSVTSIGGSAFEDCSGLTSITIPNSVTSIGGSAFYDCSGLTSITIPNSVTSIGRFAFSWCTGLISITIGNSVTSIDDGAFYGCTGLTSVNISDLYAWCKIDFSDYDANPLYYANNLYLNGKLLTDLVIPDSITEIKKYAFYGCTNLTSVTIPNSVTSIGYSAFRGCTSLKELRIEDGETMLSLGYNYYSLSGGGEGLFYDCPLETLYLGRNLSYNTSHYCYSPFYNKKELKSVTIGNSVTSIGSSAFEYCSGLTSITIPNSVTSIGGNAFYGCTGLISITIGNSVTSIGNSAFEYCSGLTSITIPNSVTSIGGHVFWNCKIKKAIWLTSTPPEGYANVSSEVHYVANDLYTSLENVTIYPYLSLIFEVGGVKYVPVGSSEHTCDAIDCSYSMNAENINIGNTVSYKGVDLTVKEIKPYICYNNKFIKSISINNNGNIYNHAFSGCSGLKDVTIGNSVTSIGDNAFYDCSGIKELRIEDSSESLSLSDTYLNSSNVIEKLYLGRNIDVNFLGKTSLKEVSIGDSVTSIYESLFSGCNGLTEVIIPNSVTSIGGSAFNGCTGLTMVDIPNSVTSIGSNAFKGCSLKIVNIADCDSLIEISSDCFGGNPIEKLYMGRNISGTPFKGFTTLKETTIGNSVTAIGNSEFSGCNGLTEVTIPNSVTSIDGSAFNGCSGLTSVIISDSITSIGDNMFYGCSALTSIKIPDRVTSIGNSAFYGCSGLTEVTIPNLVDSIGSSTFNGCSGLTEVVIPNSVASIGSNAFKGCSLKTVDIADCDSVIEISSDCFGSNPIEKLYMGRNISGTPFKGFATLKETTIGNSVTAIGNSEFSGCNGLTEVTIPNSVTSIGGSAFNGCTGLTMVDIPNSVTSIGSNAFMYCSLKTVNIVDCDSVIEISSDCFGGNPIEKLYMGRNISGTPFKGFTTLNETTIGNYVTAIGNSEFSGCNGLTEVTIPNSVTSIGGSAFNGCSGLTSVKIPNKVASIGNGAFYGCTDIKEVRIEDSSESLSLSDTYLNSSNLIETLYLGRNIDVNFSGKTSLKEVTIGNSVTAIGNNTFSGCNKLIAGGVKCLGVIPPVLAGEWALEQVEVPIDGLCNYAGAEYWSDIRIIYAKDGDKTMVPVLVENNNNPCVMVNNISTTGVSAGVNSNVSVTKSDSESGYVMVRHCNNDITDKVAGGYTFSTSIYHKENTITTYSIDTSNDYVIHVYPSGNLINQIDVNTVGDIYRLKITGDLNGTDILTIRKMSNLKILDMSEANIVNGGMSYYNEYTTSKNEIGSYFFKDKSNLEMVYLPKTATKVSNYAFGGCTRLSFVSIPDAMTYVAGNAFDQCTALAYVRFEDGFNTFDFGTENDCLLLFKDCPVENLYIGRNISFTGSSPFKNKGTLSSVMIGDLVSEIKSATFYGCTGLTTTTIGNSVTTIGSSAFYDCKKLTTLTIGNSVMAINNYAFYNCRALPELTIHDNVKTIGDYAFYHCENIASLSLGTSLQSIGDNAFSNCKSIESVIIPNSLTALGDYAFQLCEKLSLVKLGEAVNVIGNGAFKQCGSLQSIALGNSVTTIGSEAFMQCDNLEAVSLENSISSIGGSAFANCAKLNNVNIPPSVTTMGSSAFVNCSNLKNLRIENGDIVLDFGTTSTSSGNCFSNSPIEDLYVGRNISYYGDYSPFKNKTSLLNLTIGDNTTTIKRADYEGCTSLEYLVLGKAVSEIADYSFSGCTHLNTIYSVNTVPAKIYENTFNLVDKVNCMLYVPEGCRNIYWLHPYWEDFYNIVETDFVASTFEVGGISYSVILPEAQALSTYSVSDDSDVKVIAGESKYTGTVSIPDMVNHFSNAYTVTHIDAYAFSGCVDLSAITLPASVESIGNGAFGGCSGLKEVTVTGIIPAEASSTAFDGVDKNTCVLYVPFGCRELYANAPVWKEFYNIVEKGELVNVNDNIAGDESSYIKVINGKICVNSHEEALVVVYSMSGAVVFNEYVEDELSIELPNGVYIVRVGSMIKKIVL